MKRRAALVCVLLSLLASRSTPAQSLTDLFQKAKEQIKASSWKDALGTLDALAAAAAKPGNEPAQKQLEAPLAFYRGVCEANLGQDDKAAEQFAAYLRLQPNASIDEKTYSKKAVASFEKARQAAASEPVNSLADAYRKFEMPPHTPDSERVDQYWADGAVQWIMTAGEKSQWAALTDPNARVDFVEQFWSVRAAIPGTEGRTFRQEFERRVAFADANLQQEPEQRGSLSDRGMVFVLLGPPTYAGRKPLRTGDDPNDNAGLSQVGSFDARLAEQRAMAHGPVTSAQLATKSIQYGGPGQKAPEAAENGIEVWHYRKELLPRGVGYQQVDMQFTTKKGYGVQVLQRESDCITTLEAARKAASPAAAKASQP